MNDIELLALIRLALCLAAFPFAVRGRYWILSTLLLCGAGAAVVTAAGAARVVASLIATPLYALLAFHTLDITRLRHPRRGTLKEPSRSTST